MARILLIDDDLQIREMLTQFLEPGTTYEIGEGCSSVGSVIELSKSGELKVIYKYYDLMQHFIPQSMVSRSLSCYVFMVIP